MPQQHKVNLEEILSNIKDNEFDTEAIEPILPISKDMKFRLNYFVSYYMFILRDRIPFTRFQISTMARLNHVPLSTIILQNQFSY